MSDQLQPTPIDELVNRLATKIGQLTTENEWLRVQLEMLTAQQQGPDVPEHTANGQHDDAHEGVAPI